MNSDNNLFYVNARTIDGDCISMMVIAKDADDALDRTIEYWARNDFGVASGVIGDDDIFDYDCREICGPEQPEVMVWQMDVAKADATGCIPWRSANLTEIEPDVQESLKRRGVI